MPMNAYTLEQSLTREVSKVVVGKSKQLRLIAAALLVCIKPLALIGGGIYVWHILKRPDAFFDTSVRVTVTATPQATPALIVRIGKSQDSYSVVIEEEGILFAKMMLETAECQHSKASEK